MGDETRHLRRVLVADDDQSIRQLVCTIVRRERIEVDGAADGAEAIELLAKHEYSVILLDLMMPRVDGFGVIEWLQKNRPEHKPVVLVITAYADQTFKEVDPTIVAGVIRKPFEVSEIGSMVKLCVNGIDRELSEKLAHAKDSTVRRFARQEPQFGDGGGSYQGLPHPPRHKSSGSNRNAGEGASKN